MRYIFIFLNLSLLFTFDSFGLEIDTLLQNPSLAQVDTAKLNRLAKEFLHLNVSPYKRSQAKQLLDSANNLAQLPPNEIPTWLNLANAEYYLILKNFEKSSDYLKLAYESNKNLDSKDLNLYALINDCNARYCLNGGLFKESIDRYNINLKLNEKNPIKDLKSRSYLGLSIVYSVIENQEESIRCLELMLKAAEAEDNILFRELAHNGLGAKILTLGKDYKLSMYHLNKSLAYSIQLNDSTKINVAKSRIAWNYYLQNNLDSSLFFFTELLSDIHDDDFVFLSNTYGNIGTIYRDKKELKLAIEYYDKAIGCALKVNNWYNLSWIYKDLSSMYSNNHDFEKAYSCYVSHKRYSDSLKTNSFNQGLLEAREKFAVSEKEQKLELLSLKLKNQNIAIYGFAGFFMLSVFIGFLLIRQSKLNAKRRISEMNQKISEITQANLRQQMNPHFIFNTLNSIQYYMYQHDKLSTNNYLTKFSSLMRRILENSQHTSIALNDELDAVNLYLELESVRFKNKFDYEIKIDDEIDTLLYKIPTMLIQPYVENAICHGLMNKDEKGYLKIKINLKSDHLACIIEDNGIGREAAMEIRKKKEANHNSLGTKITESRLDLVNLLYGTSLKTIYTDLTDDNGKPNGTRVEIQIPILT